jgi:glycosyltransferase involved in cell wall biosynthesis
MVGDWLRDFEFANEVFKRLFALKYDLVIKVVCNPLNYMYFDKNIRLELISGISDEELLELYQHTHLLFLPLKGFTANNTVLEGGACGCKILIATNQQNGSLYLNREYVEILPLNTDQITERIISILNNIQTFNTDDQRRYVVSNYDWKVIGQRTYDLLTN